MDALDWLMENAPTLCWMLLALLIGLGVGHFHGADRCDRERAEGFADGFDAGVALSHGDQVAVPDRVMDRIRDSVERATGGTTRLRTATEIRSDEDQEITR